jgi:hypothetical protein
MKSPDSAAAAVLGSLGALSVVAVTAAFLDLYPTYESLAAADPVSLPQDSTVLPIEQPAQTTLATIHQTINDAQKALYERARDLDIDIACFHAHMQIIDSLQAEIARAEASMVNMSDEQKAQVAGYIQMNLDRINNEFEAIKGLFPAPPHGMPRNYCT